MDKLIYQELEFSRNFSQLTISGHILHANQPASVLMKLTPNKRIVTLLSLLTLFAPLVTAAPQLNADSELATAGYYQLSWTSDLTGDYRLQEANNPDFNNAVILYQGPDTATLISGRPDGYYYYRISNRDTADDNLQWSNVVQVEVAHHPLSRAFMFFAIGATVFLATLIVVVLGNKSHN